MAGRSPGANIGKYGTDYRFRAAISFVGFWANLAHDGYYPLLVQDSKGNVLEVRYELSRSFLGHQQCE
jgi:hypothetical protein